MGRARSVGVAAATVLAVLALAACGGSSAGGDGLSTLDPANMVPARALIYMSIAVKPQGSLKADLTHAIDELAGAGSAKRLFADMDKSFSKTTSASDLLDQIHTWFGERIGVALVGFPSNISDPQSLIDDLLIVVPTNDAADAKSYLSQHMNGPDRTSSVVGHYAVFGGQLAVGEALATTSRDSLAANPRFRSEMLELGPDQLFTAYSPLRPLIKALLPIIRASNSTLTSLQFATALHAARPGAAVAYGFGVGPSAFHFDYVTRGVPKTGPPVTGVPSDVSSLPGNSWLAVVLSGQLSKQSYLRSLTASLPTMIARMQAASASVRLTTSAPLRFLEQDVLPALGPMSLSISGTTKKSLRGGLVMASLDRSAGERLVTALQSMLKHAPVHATSSGGRVVLSYGYPSLDQLLAPKSRLADNPDFRAATRQLPDGGKADIFVDFGPIALLGALTRHPTPSDVKVLRVMRRLDYLIAGGTHSHFRIVLAIR